MVPFLFPLLLAAAVVAYVFGRQRALAVAAGQPSALHSRPGYHGFYAAIWAFVPALAVLVLWSLFAPRVYDSIVADRFAEQFAGGTDFERAIFIRDARALAENALYGQSTPDKVAGAELFRSLWAVAIHFSLCCF